MFSDSKKVAFFNHDFWGTRFDDYRSKRKSATPEEKLSDLYCAGLKINGFVMAAVMKTLASSEGSLFSTVDPVKTGRGWLRLSC